MIRSTLPRSRCCARAALVVAIALAGYMGALAPIYPEFGMSLAEAKHFYTRKRINGRWVSGAFPKRYAGLRRAYARLDTSRDLKPSPQPPARTEAAPAAVSATQVDSAATTAALGPALDAISTAVPPPDERLLRLRDALQARASEIVTALADPDPARPVFLRPATPDGGAEHPAAAPPSPTPDVPAPSAPASVPVPNGPGAALEPRSVSFDFETGVKTTVFENSVVREPFDVSAIKRIATPKR